ncbi:hypothetical protein BH23BAC1_BH23BAC1_51670 [soil metagenome]
MIGWDEILEGGLAPGAAVMSWQGMKGGIEAAHQQANVVMSPSPMAYLDLYQGDPSVEPPTYSMARLKDSYNWDPVPEGVDPKFILGGQGNLWTEHISNKPQIEYMAYPRVFALSEVYWSPKENKNWGGFVEKVEDHFKRFDQARQNYAQSMHDPIIQVTKNASGNLVLDLSTEVDDLDIFYTLDSTIPNQYYNQYTAPVTIPKDAPQLRVRAFRNGEPMGKLISIKTEDLEKRVKKK